MVVDFQFIETFSLLITLRIKCAHSELFWSVFYGIRTDIQS